MTGKKDSDDATAVVYSNIDAPEYKLFAVEHGAEVEFGTAGADANAHWRRANIPSANKYVGGAAGGSIDGTYRGVPGTFTCDTGCPASGAFPERRSDGSIIGVEAAATPIISDSWSFEPADEAATIKVADSDYLAFGYWLSKDKVTGPERFAVWYDGNAAIAPEADLNDIDEKVTYTGVAGGKYVVKSDVPNDATAGYFTATASITADFTAEGTDTTTVATNTGSIKGTISGFADGDSAPLGDLKLTLAGDINNTGGNLTVINDTGITAESGGRKHAGTVGGFEAQFFGEDKTTSIPTGIAGAFNATIEEQAVVAGGFGATK